VASPGGAGHLNGREFKIAVTLFLNGKATELARVGGTEENAMNRVLFPKIRYCVCVSEKKSNNSPASQLLHVSLEPCFLLDHRRHRIRLSNKQRRRVIQGWHSFFVGPAFYVSSE
jgi:hypothetical protein